MGEADGPRAVEVEAALGELSRIGAPEEAGSGWNRLAWTEAHLAARDWFADRARRLGLEVEDDAAGNRWAWWQPPGAAASPAIATGSHLDTVPDGGAFDGALGVVAGLSAVAALQAGRAELVRPVAVVAFADEEGVRFATPTFGSRVLTGALDAQALLDRRDDRGVTLGEALRAAGVDPARLGPEPERVARLAAVVELHVEQGRALADLGAPLAVGSRVWPRGRWRLRVHGESNHAGTTPMGRRRDASVVLAAAVTAARDAASRHGGVATVGHQRLSPNTPSAVPGFAEGLLDARAPDDAALEVITADWTTQVHAAATTARCETEVERVARSAGVDFDEGLRERLRAAAVRAGAGEPAQATTAALLESPAQATTASLRESPAQATAAGHDAAALAAAGVPAGMLFVRNPTGVSHAPAEHAESSDVVAGVRALTAVLEDLACR